MIVYIIIFFINRNSFKIFLFFSSRRRHTRFSRDWSSDVCSSDLERLDEIGSDFAIIYPTAGLRVPRISDDATRRAVVRAHNVVTAEYFRDLADRMTPAAIIPMHTPDEAIAELEFVTRELGAKVGMFGSGMSRRVAATPPSDPDTARLAVWYDVLALDSDHDY